MLIKIKLCYKGTYLDQTGWHSINPSDSYVGPVSVIKMFYRAEYFMQLKPSSQLNKMFMCLF